MLPFWMDISPLALTQFLALFVALGGWLLTTFSGRPMGL
jgi:hypothetical protein